MASVEDYDFQQGDAGAEDVENMEAGQIRVGGYIVIKDHPCKVTSVSTSKTGKHGHAKCNFVAIDIFTGKKYEDIIPSTHNTHVPFVKRAEYTMMDISPDGYVSLMDEGGSVREDIKLPSYPETLEGELRTAFENGKTVIVTVMSAMKTEQIVAYKEESS